MLKKHHKIAYLDITTIKFPVTAVGSILHRISGFFLFLTIGPILWILRLSLISEDNFQRISNLFLENNYIFKFLTWVVIMAFSYHVFFGIRQMLMDCGCLKQTLSMGKISVNFVFIIMICLSICFGVYIWNL